MRLSKILATAALLTGLASAQAATVTITFDKPIFGDTGHDTGKIYFPSSGGDNSLSLSVHAGRFIGKATALDGILPKQFVDSTDSVFMYCYDLYNYIGGGDRVDYTIDFTGAVDRTLQFLFAVNTVLNDSDPYAWARPTNQWQAAAIQLGIWESLYDKSGWDLAGGDFRAEGFASGSEKTLDWVGQFFFAIKDGSRLDQKFTMVLRNDIKQDMLTADPPAPIPEPGSLALLAMGLLALTLLRRRKG